MSASQLFQLSFANSRWICSFRGFGLLLQRSNAPLRIGGLRIGRSRPWIRN